MLSFLLASSGLAAVEGRKSPLCDVDWIEAASLEQIAGQLETGFTCPPRKNPLLVALESEAGMDKIRLLVANDEVANVSAAWEELSPLHLAAAYRSLEVVKLLTDRGYDINARSLEWSGASPMHAAAQKNSDAKVIDFLVERGADINAREDTGRVPLHLAARFNTRLEVLQALLAHGADTTAKSSQSLFYGAVPFHYAVLYNPNLEIAEALYKPEFLDVRIGDSEYTPLILAGYGGRAEPVEFLIDKGDEINAQDNTGATALHMAVIGNTSSKPYLGGDHLSIVKTLLENGADVSIKDYEFQTALQEAFLGSDHQPDIAVVTTLLDYGADPADINDVPCVAHNSDEEYQVPEYIIAMLEERGVAKIGPSMIDHLSCYTKRALVFIRSITS